MKHFRNVAMIAALVLAATVAEAAPKKVQKALDVVPPAILAQPPLVPEIGAPLIIDCQIVDESAIFEPTLYWRVKGDPSFATARLEPAEGRTFRASVITPQGAAEIEYFLEAYDAEGNGPARFGAPTLFLTIALKAPVVEVPLAALAPGEMEEPSGPMAWRKPTGAALIGVGVLVAVVGGYQLSAHRGEAAIFNKAFNDEGIWDPVQRDEIDAKGSLGGGLLGAGLAVIAAGTVVLVLEF